jgi:hypothetical protein
MKERNEASVLQVIHILIKSNLYDSSITISMNIELHFRR